MKKSKNLIAYGITALFLVACGGGGGEAGAPLYTPDGQETEKPTDPTNPPAENPVEETHDIKYVVGGKASGAYVAYIDNQGQTVRETVSVPWEKSLKVKNGATLYVNAQNAGEEGTISVEIFVDGKSYKYQLAEGAYATAVTSGSCCNP